MPDPLSITSGVVSLAAILAQLMSKLYSLKGILKEFHALALSLETLKDVLDRVEHEYTESLKVIDTTSKVGGALKRNIDACFTTCEKINEILTKIQNAASQHIRASFEEKTIEGLLRRLERDKSTLNLLMSSITEERQRRHQQGSKGQLFRTESDPPSYSESTALVQTRPPKPTRAKTEIEKDVETSWNGRQLSQWSERPSDDEELYSSQNTWSSREDSHHERDGSDQGDLYSIIAGTRSLFSFE